MQNWLEKVVALNVKANSMRVYTFLAHKHYFLQKKSQQLLPLR